MKQYFFLFFTLLSILLLSCSNFFENSVDAVAEEQTKNATETSVDQYLSNGLQTKTISVTGSLSLYSDAPATKRSAFPSVPEIGSDYEYYAIASAEGYTWNGTASFTSNSFTITGLTVTSAGVTWTVEVGIRKKNAPTQKLMKDSHPETLSDTSTVFNHAYVLKPAQTPSTGKGDILLEVEIEDGCGITYCTSSLTGTTKFTFTSNKTTVTKNGVSSGSTNVDFNFYNSSDILLYQISESITIFDNMKTNTWVQNGSSPYFTSDNKCKITYALIESFKRQTFYVKAGGSNDNSGSYFAPLATIAGATAKMSNTNVDYKIFVVGEVTGGQTISGSVSAKSITICGYNGLDNSGLPQDTLKGGFSSGTPGTTLVIDNCEKNVTIRNLKITGSYKSSETTDATTGSAIYTKNITNTNTKLTIDSGVLITGNTSKTAVYHSSKGPLALAGGKITGNTCSDVVYVDESNVELSGTEISSNTCDLAVSIGPDVADDGVSISGAFYADKSIVFPVDIKPVIASNLTRHSSTNPIILQLGEGMNYIGYQILPSASLAVYESCSCYVPGIVVGSDGKFKLKNIVTNIYVAATGGFDPAYNSVTECEDYTWNKPGRSYNDDVTYIASHPLASISKALDYIEYQNSSTSEYTIYISGEFTGGQVLDSTLDGYAAKISLTGVPDNITDKLNGNFTGVGQSKGSTLVITTTVPVEITNLKVTGGYADGSTDAEKSGGGIYVSASQPSLTLGTGAVVSGNEATGNGAGIFIESTHATNKATFKMCSTAQVSGNSAGNYGGGIYMSKTNFFLYDSAVVGDTGKSTYAESDTSKHSNTAKAGGGIYASASTVNIGYTSANTISPNDCTGGVLYNYASGGQGGGVFCGNNSEVYMAKGCVSYNATSMLNHSMGGGVYIREYEENDDENKLFMSGGTIAGNKSYYGGGVCCESPYIGITGGTIGDTTESLAAESACSNYGKYGGGICIACNATADTYITGGTIGRNYSSCVGGGLYLSSSFGTITVSGTSLVIKNNFAELAGGGINTMGKLYLGAEIKNNKVGSGNTGGGIYLGSPEYVTTGNSLELNSNFKISSSDGPTKGTDDISMVFDPSKSNVITAASNALSNFSSQSIGLSIADESTIVSTLGSYSGSWKCLNTSEYAKFKLLQDVNVRLASYDGGAKLDIDYSNFTIDQFTIDILSKFNDNLQSHTEVVDVGNTLSLDNDTYLFGWNNYICIAKFSVPDDRQVITINWRISNNNSELSDLHTYTINTHSIQGDDDVEFSFLANNGEGGLTYGNGQLNFEHDGDYSEILENVKYTIFPPN